MRPGMISQDSDYIKPILKIKHIQRTRPSIIFQDTGYIKSTPKIKFIQNNKFNLPF